MTERSATARRLDELLAQIEAGDLPPIPESLRAEVEAAAKARASRPINVDAAVRFVTEGPGGD